MSRPTLLDTFWLKLENLDQLTDRYVCRRMAPCNRCTIPRDIYLRSIRHCFCFRTNSASNSIQELTDRQTIGSRYLRGRSNIVSMSRCYLCNSVSSQRSSRFSGWLSPLPSLSRWNEWPIYWLLVKDNKPVGIDVWAAVGIITVLLNGNFHFGELKEQFLSNQTRVRVFLVCFFSWANAP